jgi:hypothetical protein
VRQAQAQRLSHHLRRRSGSQELAAASRRGAGPAAQFGRLLQGQLTVGKTGPNGLHLARILPFQRRQRDPAGD